MKRPKQRLVPRRSGSWTEDYLVPVLLLMLAAALILLVLVVLGALSGLITLQ